MSDFMTEKEKAEMRQLVNELIALEHGVDGKDAEGNAIKVLSIQCDDPYQAKKASRSELIEFMRNDPEFKEKFKNGHYTYSQGRIFVKGKVIHTGPVVRYLREKTNIRFGLKMVNEEKLNEIKRDLANYKERITFNDFYEALDYYMDKRGTTQLMIAQEMNVSAPYINKLVNKKVTLTVNLVVCLCLILKLSPYYSRKLLSLAGFSIEDNPRYTLYLMLINEHWNASLEFCNELIEILCDEDEMDEYRLIRK